LDALATAVETIVPLSDALLQEARVGAFKDLLATLKGKKEDVKKKRVTHADSDSSLLPAATASASASATVKSSRAGHRREALKRSNRTYMQLLSPAAAAAPSSPSRPSSTSSSSRSSSFSSTPRSFSSSTDDGSDSDSDQDSDSDSSAGLDVRDSSQMSSNLTDALGDSHRVRGASRTGLKPDPPAKPPVSTLSTTAQTQTDTGIESETQAQILMQSQTSGEPLADVESNRNAERIMRREMDLEASKEKEKDMESRIASLCKELEIERFRCKEAVAEVRQPVVFAFFSHKLMLYHSVCYCPFFLLPSSAPPRLD
jgi:hypothetical protein